MTRGAVAGPIIVRAAALIEGSALSGPIVPLRPALKMIGKGPVFPLALQSAPARATHRLRLAARRERCTSRSGSGVVTVIVVSASAARLTNVATIESEMLRTRTTTGRAAQVPDA